MIHFLAVAAMTFTFTGLGDTVGNPVAKRATKEVFACVAADRKTVRQCFMECLDAAQKRGDDAAAAWMKKRLGQTLPGEE
jgi:hypothetical protein